MKKLILFTLVFFTLATPILALTSTPSATPSVDLQNKIKSLVKENLETTENLIQKEANAKSFVGYTGKVKSVGTKNITLEVENDLLQIAILPETIITKAGSEIKTTSIALADNLLVIGLKNKDNVLETRIINVLPEVDPATIVETVSKIATFKTIDLKKKSFVLTVSGEDQNFTLSKKTTVKLEDFVAGDTILAITKKYLGKFSLSRAVKI